MTITSGYYSKDIDFEYWYNAVVILTKNTPFTKEEIEKLREVYDVYIKTVIDIQRRICSAGAKMHYESEKILISQGSKQKDIWGGGIEIEEKIIDFNSFINIRPAQKNTSNEIQDERIRQTFEEITRHFFQEVL